MALRDQPYLPLYIQDYMTDEKLAECSATANGVFVRIMCVMHKSDPYGKILLKQKDKQSNNQIENFAYKLSKHMPFHIREILSSVGELVDEGVLIVDGDELVQKRMVKDFALSEQRSAAGKNGYKVKTFAKAKPKAKAQAKHQANSENEYDNENENNNVNEGEKKDDPEKVLTYPFASDEFMSMWANWKEYKNTEFKFKYKSIQSEQAALSELSNLANGDEDIGLAIIRQSMAKGWKGFFELKTESNDQRGNNFKGGSGSGGNGKILNEAAKRDLARRMAGNTSQG